MKRKISILMSILLCATLSIPVVANDEKETEYFFETVQSSEENNDYDESGYQILSSNDNGTIKAPVDSNADKTPYLEKMKEREKERLQSYRARAKYTDFGGLNSKDISAINGSIWVDFRTSWNKPSGSMTSTFQGDSSALWMSYTPRNADKITLTEKITISGIGVSFNGSLLSPDFSITSNKKTITSTSTVKNNFEVTHEWWDVEVDGAFTKVVQTTTAKFTKGSKNYSISCKGSQTP